MYIANIFVQSILCGTIKVWMMKSICVQHFHNYSKSSKPVKMQLIWGFINFSSLIHHTCFHGTIPGPVWIYPTAFSMSMWIPERVVHFLPGLPVSILCTITNHTRITISWILQPRKKFHCWMMRHLRLSWPVIRRIAIMWLSMEVICFTGGKEYMVFGSYLQRLDQ